MDNLTWEAQIARIRKEAADALEAAQAELAEARAERDDALAFLDSAVADAPEPVRALGKWLADRLNDHEWATAELLLNAAVKECDRLAALVKEAVEGLRPFAEIPMPEQDGYLQYTRADLQRARALIAKLEGKG